MFSMTPSAFQAVRQVLPGGHVSVQSQGSTAKGTSVPTSDLDHFVRMDNAQPTLTGNQRVQVPPISMELLTPLHLISHSVSQIRDNLVKGLAQKGFHYPHAELGQNRIHLRSNTAPEVDVVFQVAECDIVQGPLFAALFVSLSTPSIPHHRMLLAEFQAR